MASWMLAAGYVESKKPLNILQTFASYDCKRLQCVWSTQKLVIITYLFPVAARLYCCSMASWMLDVAVVYVVGVLGRGPMLDRMRGEVHHSLCI